MGNLNNIGSFNRKVSFCTVASGKTGMGSPNKVYTHSFYWWMNREQNASSQEQYSGKRLIIPGRFTYRGLFKAVIDETMQLVDGNDKFNILQVNDPDGKRMFIEISVEKITG
jgi:head-tail adaptor